jgi:hypothetical protein
MGVAGERVLEPGVPGAIDVGAVEVWPDGPVVRLGDDKTDAGGCVGEAFSAGAGD